MFSALSLKIKILLGIYIFIIISIPIGAYLASEQTVFKSKAEQTKPSPTPTKTSPRPTQEQPKSAVNSAGTSSTTSEPESKVATSFGPTLSLKVNFEGRPKDNQSGRLFVGIVEGTISINPKFLLSFTADVPSSGEYGNLSLAGLNPGTKYSALLKGPAQIASASAFIMSPTVTNLSGGQAITLLSGDLNEDNTINTQDYSIAQKAIGSNLKSSNWNANADINKDGSVNTFDLAFVTKNFGKIGDSGSWTSPLPKTSTPSGSLTPSSGGYWLWVPGF